MLLLCVENDQLFPEEILNDGVQYLKANGIEHEVKVYPGVPHGMISKSQHFYLKHRPVITDMSQVSLLWANMQTQRSSNPRSKLLFRC